MYRIFMVAFLQFPEIYNVLDLNYKKYIKLHPNEYLHENYFIILCHYTARL